MTPEHTRAARDLLGFYVEAGVDALLGEEPVDRLSAAQLESMPAPGAARRGAAPRAASARRARDRAAARPRRPKSPSWRRARPRAAPRACMNCATSC